MLGSGHLVLCITLVFALATGVLSADYSRRGGVVSDAVGAAGAQQPPSAQSSIGGALATHFLPLCPRTFSPAVPDSEEDMASVLTLLSGNSSKELAEDVAKILDGASLAPATVAKFANGETSVSIG